MIRMASWVFARETRTEEKTDMAHVFVMWHRYVNEFGVEDEKGIGVFSSEENARRVAEQLRTQPGFRSHPDGFQILECTVDQTSWQEGLVGPGPIPVPAKPIE